ncbi:hypothetical protein JHK85_057712 [Glycine max]|nr:hypothetical protein JHK85_057712 [Glycine max]
MAAGGAESDVSAVVGGGSRSGVLVELAEVRRSQGTDVVGEKQERQRKSCPGERKSVRASEVRLLINCWHNRVSNNTPKHIGAVLN